MEKLAIDLMELQYLKVQYHFIYTHMRHLTSVSN